jgi:hypothetical protein
VYGTGKQGGFVQRTLTIRLDDRQLAALTAAVATEVARLGRLPFKMGSDHERELHLLDGYDLIRTAWYGQEYPTPHHETAGEPADWAADLAIDHTIEEA